MTAAERILHLEDSPEDAELIGALLDQGGLGAELRWVTTRAAFQQALEEPWDLILADYALPGIRDRQALELALARRPDVPFIYISGTMGETTAIECLHHGAADYILKQGLSRLVPAARRALAEAAERGARRQAEVALLASEADYRRIAAEQRELLAAISAAGIVPWSRDPGDGSVLMGSGSEALLGWAAEHFRTPGFALATLAHPEDRPAFLQALARAEAGETCSLDLRVVDAEARPVWTRWTLSTTGGRLHGAIRDVSEPHHLLDLLIQSQKLESMGTLAGGVAHDVNSLLTVLFVHLDLIRTEGLVTESLERHFQAMGRAAEHVQTLVGGLLSFARKKEPRRVAMDLNQVVLEARGLFGAVMGPGVSLESALEPRLPSLLLDGGQIHQVLMNLMINARDALPEGGMIRLATWTVPGSVVLEVSDTGQGIAPDLISRIFEPFFTTKPEGKGTGLGLAMAYGIVTAHGGTIHCASTVGKGTRFRITFPT